MHTKIAMYGMRMPADASPVDRIARSSRDALAICSSALKSSVIEVFRHVLTAFS
ncbi:MAG TPA: hypothetical protein VHI13_06110 [Candidatus Kapabacteria bacterium]|nr:hypothetical protein [Candidatus Kapabacteria bacterium]